jgi:hypothetical protein
MTTSHLLRLPVELHLGIVDKLELHVAANLACTNRYFSSIIARPSHAEYLVAETETWAKEKALFVCSGHVTFRRFEEFADDMKKGRYTRGGVESAARLCLECGAAVGLYAQGTTIVIYGKPHVLCRHYRASSDRATGQAVCATCSPGSPFHPIRSASTVYGYYAREGVPIRSSRTYYGKAPIDELYGPGLTLKHDDDV